MHWALEAVESSVIPQHKPHLSSPVAATQGRVRQ